MFLDQVDGFHAVLALRHDLHVVHIAQQVMELVARELFVIHDECGQSHG